MNPHRYVFGIASTLPLSAIVAACTLLGLLICKDKEQPMKGAPVWWFLIFTIWLTVSWLVGLDVAGDYEQWKKVIKINLMILVSLAVMRTRQQIALLALVTVASLAILGLKGGFFTIIHGGNYRVWGPPGSFIEDNNEFALAMVMVVPLLNYLYLSVSNERLIIRWGLIALMLIVALCALGSQSRGGFLAIIAMTIFLWVRSKRKFLGAIVLSAAAVSLITFMPARWTERMDTIQSYEQDGSAMGRLSAWSVAFEIAKNYPSGVGFNPARRDLHEKYSWYGGHSVPAAHSIYFQVLGNHGFIGLFLFLGVMISTWRQANLTRTLARGIPEAAWAFNLVSMLQVSLAGYLVGGLFLSLAYFDLPYILMVITVLTKNWVEQKAWIKEGALHSGWRGIFGLTEGPANLAKTANFKY